VPHRIIIAPLAAIYVLLAAVCGIESTAVVLAAAGIFAVLAYAFAPGGRHAALHRRSILRADAERKHRLVP
jgi:hypothetical protein